MPRSSFRLSLPQSYVSINLLLLLSPNFSPIPVLPYCLWAFGFTWSSPPASHAPILLSFKSVTYIASSPGKLVLQTAVISPSLPSQTLVSIFLMMLSMCSLVLWFLVHTIYPVPWQQGQHQCISLPCWSLSTCVYCRRLVPMLE